MFKSIGYISNITDGSYKKYTCRVHDSCFTERVTVLYIKNNIYPPMLALPMTSLAQCYQRKNILNVRIAHNIFTYLISKTRDYSFYEVESCFYSASDWINVHYPELKFNDQYKKYIACRLSRYKPPTRR